MQADRFTIKSQEALAPAARQARRKSAAIRKVTPLHLLAALLSAGDAARGAAGQVARRRRAGAGVVLPVLTKLGVDAGALRASVEQAISTLPVLGAWVGRA